MLATFANKLETEACGAAGDERILFEHSFRCPIEVWFEKTEDNQYGWVLQFKSPSDSLLNEFRGPIFKQVVKYLEMRSRRKITDVTFDEILSMAEALEIKSAVSIATH